MSHDLKYEAEFYCLVQNQFTGVRTIIFDIAIFGFTWYHSKMFFFKITNLLFSAFILIFTYICEYYCWMHIKCLKRNFPIFCQRILLSCFFIIIVVQCENIFFFSFFFMFSVEPPTNVTLFCHNLKNLLQWSYDEPVPGLRFRVEIRSLERSLPALLTEYGFSF